LQIHILKKWGSELSKIIVKVLKNAKMFYNKLEKSLISSIVYKKFKNQ
jgi:hypothetical protein